MQTFSKSERLCSKVLIDKVFEKGKVIVGPSFKLIWLCEELQEAAGVQVLISVPKRNFKKAVDRNKIKRRMREAYRKNKEAIYNINKDKTVCLMLMYTGKTIIPYAEAEEKIIKLLQRLIPEIRK
ncbi:MAG: ribonuclease protein component [Bacteroidota bacterium]|jgi:ribonuclease P protein component|nr:ribonuclease protein component [Bacteroidota bacterium]